MLIKDKVHSVFTIVDGQLPDGRFYKDKDNKVDDGFSDIETVFFSPNEWEKVEEEKYGPVSN